MTSHLSIDEEVAKLTSYFTSLSFNVTLEWLYGCVQYFRTENPRCSESEMRDSVTKQWELSDLRDSSRGCLPENLNSHQKITLRGKYVLQIESVINIGMSAYSQIQKIRKVDIENVELTEKKPESWEPKSKRMLKMSLCDGPRTAEAIEYRTLPMLFEQITPGTKIVIIGPVDCRRGCFFLKPQNLKIIGGEVDSLLITNYMENVLARILNLPENEDPYSSQTPVPEPPRTSTAELTSQSTAQTASRSVDIHHRTSMNQASTNVSSRTVQNLQTNNASTNFNENSDVRDVIDEIVDLDVSGWEDDDLIVDETALLEIEEAHTSSNNHPNASITKANSEFTSNGSSTNKRKAVIGNSDIGVPPKVPKTNANECNSRKTTNIHNSFLASDDYVDDLLELENDEFNELTPEIISVNNHNNNYECEFNSTTSTRSMNPSSLGSNHSNPSSFSNKLQNSSNQHVQKKQEKPNFQNKNRSPLCSSRDQQFAKKSNSVIKEPLKVQSSSNASIGQQMVKRPGSVTAGQARNSSISSWCKKNNISSQPPATEMPLVSSKSNVEVKESKVKSSVSGSKFSSNSKDSLPLLIDVSDEEDWADAYLNTSNFSFMNKFSNIDDAEIKEQSSSTSSFGKSSELQDPKKQSTPIINRSDRFKVPDNKTVDKTRSPFKRSQNHLPAAFCSPNDFDDNVDVTLIPSDDLSMDPFCDFPSTSNSRISFHPNLEKTSKTGLQNSIKKWECPIKTPDPFQYLLHVLHSQPKKSEIYKFKATILTLLSQLTIKEEREWTLTAKIGDGTASLDVQFTSDVLEEIIGLSPREFKEMKREVSKNPLVKEKLRKVLKSSQQKLVELNCIFSIQFEENKMATVIKLSDVTQQDVNKFKLRLSSK